MKVLFGEDLGAADETCVEICRDKGSRGEGIAATKIADKGGEFIDSKEIEACPVETIIRIWRQLRGDLRERSPGYSLLSLR